MTVLYVPYSRDSGGKKRRKLGEQRLRGVAAADSSASSAATYTPNSEYRKKIIVQVTRLRVKRLAPFHFQAMRKHFKRFQGLAPGSQGQDLAVTVLYVPYSRDNGYRWIRS